MLNSWYEYGNENFEYYVLEYLNEEDEDLAREVYWMNKLNSLNKEFGYNLRQDSSTKMITHPSTSEKISNRLKSEWANGSRAEHGEKLSANWNTTPERRKEQSLIMSRNKTKYYYKLYSLDDIFLEKCDFKRLKELSLSNVLADYHKKNVNKVKFKTFLIERIKIEDIVRSS